jgi:hypothetical protein
VFILAPHQVQSVFFASNKRTVYISFDTEQSKQKSNRMWDEWGESFEVGYDFIITCFCSTRLRKKQVMGKIIERVGLPCSCNRRNS